MKKLLITNVVYGPVYANIFLNQHLKSMLDPTNIPQMRDRIEYAIYSDADTLKLIQGHPNFEELKKHVKVHLLEFGWQGTENRFEKRYGILHSTFRLATEYCLKTDMLLSAMVADHIVAKHYMPKVFYQIDQGHDSVFCLPMRTAFEAMAPQLNNNVGAMFASDLFELGYKNLHPLWVACHWDAAQFSKIPYSLVWNSGTGLLVQSFSITPIVLTPSAEIAATNHVIDVEVPGMCKNPYWARNWTDCPIIGVEPLFCYYPPFKNHQATVEWVKEWAKHTLHKTQVPFVKETLYFPDEQTVNATPLLKFAAAEVVEALTEGPEEAEID